jgi:hypothetical protein
MPQVPPTAHVKEPQTSLDANVGPPPAATAVAHPKHPSPQPTTVSSHST